MNKTLVVIVIVVIVAVLVLLAFAVKDAGPNGEPYTPDNNYQPTTES